MGTWGAGNFADDKALDWLGHDVVRPLVDTIETNTRCVASGNDHVITAAVEVLALLCEQLRAVPPEPERVVRWRDVYLQTWDGYIDDLSPKEDYKAERRAVIVSTFDRLLAQARNWHAIPLWIEFDEAIPESACERLREQLHAALVTAGAGELTAGETLPEPNENKMLTVLRGRAFAPHYAARSVLRSLLRELDIRSAQWLCFGEPVEEYGDVW